MTRNECADWRGSHLNGPDLFWYSIPEMEEEIPRYPSFVDTEDYLATPTEKQSVETDNSDSSERWTQLLMPQDLYNEADPGQDLPPDSDMDMREDLNMEVD